MVRLKTPRSLVVLLASIVVGLVVALPANTATTAYPIVNGGFETGDFTGWTVFAPAPGGAAVIAGGAPVGTYYAEVMAGAGNTWMTLSQNYVASTGQRLTFWVNFVNGETGGFCDLNDQARVRVDGTTVWSASSFGTGSTGWVRVTTPTILGGFSHTVSFEVLNVSDDLCDSFIQVDDVRFSGLYKVT